MASSFSVYLALKMLMVFSFMLSSSSSQQPIPKVPTLSSSPATLTDPPPSSSSSSISPFQELSPDIAPLLPSPGGVLPTPTGSVPTIPSSPSPPNPDDMVAPGPHSAFSPFGSMQASSYALESSVCNSVIAALAGLAVYWCMQNMRA